MGSREDQLNISGSGICITASGATVSSWGYDSCGQLGDATTKDRRRPVSVKTAGGRVLGGIKAIAGGNAFSLALRK